MSKTETLRQLSAAKNAQRIEHFGSQIQRLKEAELSSTEELAKMLEPLAQAMASLTDETHKTLTEVEARSREQGEAFERQIAKSVTSYNEAARSANQAADNLSTAGSRLEWKHYGLAIVTGISTAILVSLFWLWLAPPTVNNYLNAKEMAAYLKPAVIEALNHSRDR